MKLEYIEDMLTISYDFDEKRLSFRITNPEDKSETQINIGRKATNQLQTMLEIIANY